MYSLNAGKVMMPASNMKILTGTVGLALLGPDYRYSTRFAARGIISDSVLNGDLVVIGRGDPSVSDSMQGDAMKPLRAMADSLLTRGIRRISGNVLSGGNAFSDAIYGYGWEWDDFGNDYSAPVDELFFNDGLDKVTKIVNSRDTVVDSATSEPIRSYLLFLGRALRERGITIGGTLGDSSNRADTSGLTPIFTYWSPPLRSILRALEKPSQNQIAEIIFKTLALEQTGFGRADSARAVVTRQLLSWGAESDGFVVKDGSGLSRHNLVSPETIVRVFAAIQRDTAFHVFYDALSIAGVDGTLKSRMKGTPAQGNMHAKTGTIEFARNMSGYVKTAAGDDLIFSLLFNNFTLPVAQVTHVQDVIGTLLASYTGRTH